MRFLQTLVAVVAVASQALAGPTIAKAGTAKDIIVNENDTLNSTHVAGVHMFTAATSSTAGSLKLSLVNNYDSNNVNAYVTGLDNNGNLVMLQPNGQWYYPVAGSSGVPQPINGNVSIPLGPKGSITNITLPSYLSAGRVWFADGDLQFFTVPGGTGTALVQPSAANPSDPNADTNWGFCELTNISSGIYVNLSYVDFLGMPLGIQLVGSAGTQTVQGVTANAVQDVCADLQTQASEDGQPWESLCVEDTSGNLLRVLSPALYLSVNTSAFSNYWTNYIEQVWTKYTNNPLSIDTQAWPGVVSCYAVNGSLSCAGDNTAYAKPSAIDIFGCAQGPFLIQGGNEVNLASVPRLCAAFNRGTLLLSGGNEQPFATESAFYSTSPANFYSKFVHAHEADGKGYAFSYDDVVADGGENLSGLLADPAPQLLAITVGGPTNLVFTATPTTTQTTSTYISATTSAITSTTTSTTTSSTTPSMTSTTTTSSATSSVTSTTTSATIVTTLPTSSSITNSTVNGNTDIAAISSTDGTTTSPSNTIPTTTDTTTAKSTTKSTTKSAASTTAKTSSTTKTSSTKSSSVSAHTVTVYKSYSYITVSVTKTVTTPGTCSGESNIAFKSPDKAATTTSRKTTTTSHKTSTTTRKTTTTTKKVTATVPANKAAEPQKTSSTKHSTTTSKKHTTTTKKHTTTTKKHTTTTTTAKGEIEHMLRHIKHKHKHRKHKVEEHGTPE